MHENALTHNITGIIWVGLVYDRAGFGNVSRNYLVGLSKIGYPVRVYTLGPRHAEIDANTYGLLKRMETVDIGHNPVVIINTPPSLFKHVKVFGAARIVGCTIFETDRISQHWVRDCNRLDEIWVPSHFNYKTFARSGVEKQKLRILPYALDTSIFKPSKATSKKSKEPFTFLYIFAFNWRKGFDLLLEAFYKEFKYNEARLILQVHPQGYHKEDTTRLKKTILNSVKKKFDLNNKKLPELIINHKPISTQDLVKLYSICDLYISTDRANGWGMPCMEAMALGKPAATINWSGSTEFMNENNSLLIKPTGRLVKIDPRLVKELPEIYSPDQRWAEVKVSEVQRVMRWAVEHPHELSIIANQGQRDIHTYHSPEVVATRLVQNLIKPQSQAALWPRFIRPRVHIGSWRSLISKALIRDS